MLWSDLRAFLCCGVCLTYVAAIRTKLPAMCDHYLTESTCSNYWNSVRKKFAGEACPQTPLDTACGMYTLAIQPWNILLQPCGFLWQISRQVQYHLIQQQCFVGENQWEDSRTKGFQSASHTIVDEMAPDLMPTFFLIKNNNSNKRRSHRQTVQVFLLEHLLTMIQWQ